MATQTLRQLENKEISKSYIPQNFHGLQLHNYEHQFLKKRDVIFLPEQSSKNIYFIIEGKVKIGIYLESGKEVTQSILTKGRIFGELSFIGATKHKQFASAWMDTIICAIPVGEVKDLMNNNTDLNLFFIKKIGSKLINREKQLESLTFKNSRTRIIEFIIDLANNNGIQVGYERLLNNFFYTHKEIADITATSRQTVTTILNELRSKNLLIFNRKRMLIRDMSNLSAEIFVS